MEKLRQIISRNFNGWTVLVIILTFILGWQLGHRDYQLAFKNYKPDFKIVNQSPPSGEVEIDFKLFWDTWELVSRKYIDKSAIDPQKMYFGAIQGMVAAIGDPYTVFLPPQAQKTTKEQLQGSFDGVGMQLGYNKDKRLVVIAPLKDTPAEKAGVKAGDLILKVGDKDTASLSLPEAVSLIRGPKGTSITLTLLSENESKPKEVKITRDTIVVKTVSVETKDVAQGEPDSPVEERTTKSGKTVAVIRISGFGEKTKDEWDMAVSDALSKAPQGVVVDVRNNPGGFLDAAVYIASEFLESGTIVVQEDYQGNKQNQTVVRAGKMLKIPVVVLINKGSASASEILAGAIQDRKRGILIGEQSFGKGTIQSAEDLPQGTGIHITTAKWLTPSERWIHNIGLTPDVKVENDEDPAKDEVLERALDELDR
jgi:carboxyl-terminal processing protease